MAAAGCGGGRRASVAIPAVGMEQRGIASWYGPPYHGRATASGETYDMEQWTAAHRTFAFGTRVRVENLDNGSTTEVRINDRGPFVRGRIIDLSRAAARSIGMLGPGTAQVRLVVMARRAVEGEERFAVQVGAFEGAEAAERLRARADGRWGAARVRRSGLYRVWVGEWRDRGEAEKARAGLEGEFPGGFVVRME